jgi:hypothetical protein
MSFAQPSRIIQAQQTYRHAPFSSMGNYPRSHKPKVLIPLVASGMK